MATFAWRYKQFSFNTLPGDVYIQIVSYLADATGVPFVTSTGAIDTMTVVTQRSALPVGPSYTAFFQNLIASYINEKYTSTTSGNTETGFTTIEGIPTTAGLITGMTVTGSGIPANATIAVIRGPNSIDISDVATATANSIALTFSPQSFTITYDDLTYLLNVVNFGNM